jgi:hypothetical protein
MVCINGSAVYACESGVLGGVLDDCGSEGKICSLGRCTSSDCQLAERNTNSLVGCLFYTLQAENVASDEGARTSFLVTNPGDDTAALQIERPGGTSADGRTQWMTAAGIQIGGGQSGSLFASDVEATGAGTIAQSALRVSSDRPVTVVEIESDDSQENASSTGGTMLLPIQSLGIDYRAVTYPQAGTPAIAATPGSRGGAARVIVVGTQPGSVIHFMPFGPITADPAGGTPALTADQDYQVVLNDGDVFQIYSGADDEDLTGSQIAADQPIAVFSGNISTTYGSATVGINSPDMAHEQMPPVATWSHLYVAAALTPEASIGCTSFFGVAGASVWRILASADGTTITFDGPGASTLERLTSTGVAEPFAPPLVLGGGEAQSLLAVGNFTITANNPILVTQGMDCEPSLSLAIAADSGALLLDLRFAVLPNFDQLLGVVRPHQMEVDLDDTPLPDAMFRPAGSQFDVAAVPLPACSPSDGICTHHLTAGAGFGMTLRGMDVSSSYALTAPALVGCDPAYEVCID